jgi:lipopolysaccharide/colanic/teichoic acid biosynthesis glycosyltransferase
MFFSANSQATAVQIPTNYIQANMHPSVVSKTKRLLDIIGALVGLVVTALTP